MKFVIIMESFFMSKYQEKHDHVQVNACVTVFCCQVHKDQTKTETLTLLLNITHIKSSSSDIFNRWKKRSILHLLTKFLKAQQSHPIQVFGLKIIWCSIFQRCTFPKALLIALCPLLGRIMIIFHIVLGVMHRKFNTQKVNAIN